MKPARLAPPPQEFTFERASPAVINGVFTACSNYVYKHDNVSPAAAFHELVKVVFLKLSADRELHARFGARLAEGKPVPAAEVVFSASWIETMEARHEHPLDLQFQRLCARLEEDVARGASKRIFDPGEAIHLRPDTAKAVVAMLERFDLYGVDEDLNGRLFEAFLNASMRGRELGQYFTPRSVVKLMAELAYLQTGAERVQRVQRVQRVIDPCCGSGGFLIEARALLARRSPQAPALWGIDVGREPPIARIARINMHLQGDGGGGIHEADGLDKALLADGPRFDVILTNPPFAKEYDPKVAAERAILASYDLARAAGERQRLRSSVLFLERYRDLLRPGGKVLAVVDDSVLGNKRYAWVRAFVREHFIVRAVVSLPGDAFQRSGARVKTSILYLRKRLRADEPQPDVFMWYCSAVGVDDSARQRLRREDAGRREEARAEIAAVVAAFRAAEAGARAHLVPAAAIADRLDVKSCVLRPGRKVEAWRARGLTVEPLRTWAVPRAERARAEETVRLLSVRYDGHPDQPALLVRASIQYAELYVVRAGDLVVSHINAVHGAICVLPEALDGVVVSPEYTVLTPRPGVSAHALWAILRSPEVRAELLTRASGLGRHRIDADLLVELPIPAPTGPVADAASTAFRQALALELEATTLRRQAEADLQQALDLRSPTATQIIQAFKPPR